MPKPLVINGIQQHFRQLMNPDACGFTQFEYFCESAPGVTVEKLLDASAWGQQPRIVRGTIVRVLAEDNAFYISLLCTSSVGGFPAFRLISRTDLAPAAGETPVEGDRVEYILGLGWNTTFQHQVVGTGMSEPDARQLLAEKQAGAKAGADALAAMALKKAKAAAS